VVLQPGRALAVELALDEAVRRKVLDFALNVLAAPRFDPARANAYCGA